MKTTIAFLVLIFFFTVLHPTLNNKTVPSKKTNSIEFIQPAINNIPEKTNNNTRETDGNVKADSGKAPAGKPENKEASQKYYRAADDYFVWIVL